MSAQQVFSVYTQSPEKRPLKRHRMGPPDVYPQEARQEEDNMTQDRVKRGFIISVPSCEYESMVFNVRHPKYIDDAINKAAFFTKHVIQKKSENNLISLDRKRLKEGTFQQFNMNTNISQKPWFDDLAKKKSLQHLAKKIPYFNEKRKEECFELLYQSKVPIQRAIWFLKIAQVGYSTVHDRNRTKKPLIEQYSIDQTKLITRSIRDMLNKISSVAQSESSPAYQRWPYFACLFKHAFEEGIVDRQEFLMELCDILTEFADYPLDKPQVFRMLITFTSQFVDVATQNVIIARRLGHIICSRLARYKYDYDQKKNIIHEAEDCFQELFACQHHRAALLTMIGILHALIVDCPAAFVFNISELSDRSDLRQNPVTQQLCGSPLDQFPFPEDVLVKHFSSMGQKMAQIIKMRLLEIRQRSRIVDSRWALSPSSQTGFEQVVETCINVLSALDMADMTQQNALLLLYRDVFYINKTEKTEYQKEMLIRLRICFQWAITTERYGTHRALIVAQLLQKRLQLSAFKNEHPFAGFRIQEILTDFLTHESPRPESPTFRYEYANMIHLFIELQRLNIFSHDCYVKGLLRCGLLNQTQPIMAKLSRLTISKAGQTAEDEDQQHLSPMKAPQPTPPQQQTTFQQDPAIISFIPTAVDRSPLPVLERPNLEDPSLIRNRPTTSSSDEILIDGEGRKGDCRLLDDYAHQSDEHILLDSPNEMSVHERFLIQLPIEQVEENRDTCNQRASVLYGIIAERETAKNELRRVAHDICKIWQKRIHVQFFPNSKEVLFKRRNLGPISDVLTSFRQQTYYDQKVITGWCTDSFMQMIYEFIDGESFTLPTMESLDILCGMMDECRDIHGIVLLAIELIPQIVELEQLFSTFHSDCVPGVIGSQLAYVICCYLAEHIDYFLICKEAATIVNSLLHYFKLPLEAKGYPITGWSRAVCMFIWHVRIKLKCGKMTDVELDGDQYSFEEMMPKAKFSYLSDNLRYNKLFFTDMLDTEPRRFFCYHNYKLHLPSIENDHTKFSFVVNAFKAALACGRDFEKLAELANFCSHVSAQKSMVTEWCSAIQQFCYSRDNEKRPFVEILNLDLTDTVTHYTISTFTLLLAAKYCFSVNLLITYLLEMVFKPLINKCENLLHSQQSTNSSPLTESNLCLVLRICTGLVCARDVPFNVASEEKHTDTKPKKPFGYSADLRGLRLLQVCEMDGCIFPLLSAVCILADYVKKFARYNDSSLPSFVKCSLLAMCEEEWVVRRVFWICEAKDFDAFHAGRHQSTSMGQTLVQIALRRRSERRTKQELMVCNGNSKKSLLEKLFTAMNMWNFRATYYDLMLMIKEIPFDSKNAQYGALADALFGEIGRCCRELFIKAKQNPQLLQPPAMPSFKFSQINCYWLVAPLIRACPAPSTIQSSNIKAKFLKEAATMLEMCEYDANFDIKPNDLLSMQSSKCSAWLLSQQPFVNLILACVDGEESDGLVQALLKQFQEIIQRVKDNPTLPHRYIFTFEREGLLLRLSLIGGLFDSLLESNVEWALVLFQLLYYGIISPDRDREYFDACYDMLSMIIHSSLISSQVPLSLIGKESSSSSRFSAYNSIVRKIKKELGDRVIPTDLNCLAQLLPIPKSYSEQSAWDSFAAQSPQKSKSGQSTGTAVAPLRPNQPLPIAVRLDKFPTLAQKNIIRLLQHTHFIDFPAPGIWGVFHPKDLFLQQPEVEADHHYHQQQFEHQRPAIMSAQSNQSASHQQQIFSPGMNANQPMLSTPLTPSERPIVPPVSNTQMNSQIAHQQAIIPNMASQPQQMPNSMQQAQSNPMSMPQQPPPNYLSQPSTTQMPKMHGHQLQMPGHHYNTPNTSSAMMQQQNQSGPTPDFNVHGMTTTNPTQHQNMLAMMQQQQQISLNQAQSQQITMDRAPTTVGTSGRGGRKKSVSGQGGSGGSQRGQKRKKESKTNLFQAPDYNLNNSMNPGPMNPGSMNPGPMNSGPMNSGPMNSGPMNSGPMNPGPMNPGSMNPSSMNQGPMNSGPMNSGSMNSGPMNPGPMNPGPMNSGPMNPGPINPGSMNQGPMNPGSMNQGPMNPGSMNPGPMHHPSTAQFPHAPPSTHQYSSIHHHHQQQQQQQMGHPNPPQQQQPMWNMPMNASTLQQQMPPQNRLSHIPNAPSGPPSQIMPNDLQSHEGKAKLHDKLMEKMAHKNK